MMKRIFLIIICLSSLVLVGAQTASDYCHTVANHFIQGEKKAAKSVLSEALQKYPNDPKLKNLADKVNKLPDDDKKNQQNQQNQQQNDQNKNDQNKDQQQKSQQPQPKPQISKENAQQILDALQQDEKNTQEKAKKQQVRGSKKAEKDW
jgi:Ca-activated chloride channel homolog